MRYRMISDPGHGWLEVPLREVQELGIADEISSCSYFSPKYQTVYLEEDCDAGLFLDAKIGLYPEASEARQEFFRDEVQEVYQENTFVRGLNCYTREEA